VIDVRRKGAYLAATEVVPGSLRRDPESVALWADRYRLHDPALRELATIVRGADTGELELAPQAAGLLAISLGLSRLFRDDQEMLRQGMVIYDALYAWCKEGKGEVRSWNPDAYRTGAAS
jgi:hypothetical protein